MKTIFYGLALCFLAINGLKATETPDRIHPRLLKERWPARWITNPGQETTDFTVLHFRKEVSFTSVPDSLWIHVSADSRYRLYVNGQWVSHGPAASDLRHWQFESLDIAPYLKAGNNVVSAEVWNSGAQRPMAHMSFETGFILQQGDLQVSYGLDTDSSWQVCRNESYNAVPAWGRGVDIGPAEFVDFSRYPIDRSEPDQAGNRTWTAAKEGSNGVTKWSVFNQAGRLLVPRSIPAMRMEPVRFASLRKSEGVSLDKQVFQKKVPVVVPAHTKAEWLIDQEELTNAYPVLKLNKGKDAVVHIAYAEALYDSTRRKGHRDDIEGKVFRGFQDGLKASGKQISYMPLWYRTFRYVKVSVETKDEPLEVEDFYAIKSEYPFELQSSFKTEDPFLDTVLDIGWRTAKLCAMETYMDCPYYERLQYVGDTRIQGLVSLYNSGDDRLLRQALEQFDQSRMAEGITLSRFPTNYDQQIPPFSLWWIGMVHDYWMYRGDQAFIQELMPGIRQVLAFFERFQHQDGSLGEMPYWNFTDWVEREGWVFGVPPNAKGGNSALLDFQLLWAYQLASLLEEEVGMPANARYYSDKAARLQASIKQKYWSEKAGLFADENRHQHFSQHANVLAVLTETVVEEEAQGIMDRVLTDTSLSPTSIYFRYYQMLALKKAGYADRYLSQLEVWKDHVDAGLTTWAEISDTKTTRSDCHAWGASPNIELYRIVLGIDSDGPGFSKVIIEPALGKLKQASGTIPHPKGPLSVSYLQTGSIWKVAIQMPSETTGRLIWKGKVIDLQGGVNNEFNL